MTWEWLSPQRFYLFAEPRVLPLLLGATPVWATQRGGAGQHL